MLGVATLAVYAVIQKSFVMFVSAGAIGLIVYLFRRARVRDRVIAIIVAGLGGGIGAEIAHTLYRHVNATDFGATGDSGTLFMSAILLGLINAAVVVVILFIAEAWQKFAGRKSR